MPERFFEVPKHPSNRLGNENEVPVHRIARKRLCTIRKDLIEIHMEPALSHLISAEGSQTGIWITHASHNNRGLSLKLGGFSACHNPADRVFEEPHVVV